MSRGHGARQRTIVEALRESSGSSALSAAEITRRIDGPRPTAAQLRSTQRAIAGLLADGTLTETRRRGTYRGAVNGGPGLRVYLLAPALRSRGTRTPCKGCGRRIMQPWRDPDGVLQPPRDLCRACALEVAVTEARKEGGSVRGRLRRDERLEKLVTLALDAGATEEEALTALRMGRRRTASSREAMDTEGEA